MNHAEPHSCRLAEHPNRLKWNARYLSPKRLQTRESCPLFDRVVAEGIPDGPVLELACGISGQALALAELGRDVTAVDISDEALSILGSTAKARGLDSRLELLQADLNAWRPPVAQDFALVFCVMYWEQAVFDYAWPAVAAGGLIAWQGFTLDHLRYRPSQKRDWCFKEGEPADRLPDDGFTVLHEEDVDEGHRVIRRMVARRSGA